MLSRHDFKLATARHRHKLLMLRRPSQNCLRETARQNATRRGCAFTGIHDEGGLRGSLLKSFGCGGNNKGDEDRHSPWRERHTRQPVDACKELTCFTLRPYFQFVTFPELCLPFVSGKPCCDQQPRSFANAPRGRAARPAHCQAAACSCIAAQPASQHPVGRHLRHTACSVLTTSNGSMSAGEVPTVRCGDIGTSWFDASPSREGACCRLA